MDGGKDEWMEGGMKQGRDGEMIKWEERWIHGGMVGCVMDGRRDGGVDEWIRGRMDGCQRGSRHVQS